MKKSTIILVVFLVLSILASIILSKKWIQSQKEYNNLYESHQGMLNNGRIDTLIIRETKIDTIAGTATFMYNPRQTMNQVNGYVSKGVVDTMARALEVAVREVQSLKSYIVSIKGKGRGERVTDTVTKTEWLVLKNDPVFDVRVNLNNDSIFPSVRLKLTQAYAPYRKNIFARTEYRSIIQASDPRVQISEVIDVTRIPKSKRWGLGVSAGPYFSQSGLSYGVGIGFTYDIIQF